MGGADMGDGTFVGLDVHARSVVAGLIDGRTGEVRTTRAPHATGDLVGWLRALPGPVHTTYEAGPTGYGLARALEGAGIACLVAAPGRIPRASGDRVKNDRRDAERLARLLRAGELVAVAVPSITDEGARDLVRAREDARADLMRARHRLSKMLLRYGRVYDKGARSATHDLWLRRQRLDESGARRHRPAAEPNAVRVLTPRAPATPAARLSSRRARIWPLGGRDRRSALHRRPHCRSMELGRRREGCRPEVRARPRPPGCALTGVE
jgi:hypothetical protein